jgi:hypothetical protein
MSDSSSRTGSASLSGSNGRPSVETPFAEAFERRILRGRKTWRCFHCGDVFTNPKHAASHFGLDELQEPGCVAVLRHGEGHLLDRIRDLEQQLRRYQDEDSDVMRWAAAKESGHREAFIREEERGYDKGIRDTLAMPDAERAALKQGAEQGFCEAKGATP